MRGLCLDTSAYSHLMRGDPAVLDVVTVAHQVALPAIVLGELRAGFLRGSRPAENESILAAFLARPVVRVLDVDDEAARLYAEIFSDLHRAGIQVPTNDLWIAAVALREALTLVSFDDHFRRIGRVKCIIL